MVHDMTLHQLGCAVNGTDMKRIRDICLRECLAKLQTASRSVIRSGPGLRQTSLASFRIALRTADTLRAEQLCWRDRRTLERILRNANQLEAYLTT